MVPTSKTHAGQKAHCGGAILLSMMSILTNLAPTSTSAQYRSPADPLVTFSKSLTSVPDAGSLLHKGTLYVPAYSSVRIEQGQTQLDLAITLSIHNSSETEPLVINRIDFFNTSGVLVQHFLSSTIALRPFGTLEIFISRDDARGGTSANFIIDWAAKGLIEEPIAQAVMIGSIGTNSYSFTTQGRATLKR